MKCFLLLIPFVGHALAGDIPREAAFKNFDSNAASARAYIDKSPGELWTILVWRMARPIGDAPKVLSMCDEVITKSTTTASATVGVECVATLLKFHRDSWVGEKMQQIAAVATHALGHRDLRVRLEAAGLFDLMGRGFERASRKAYLTVLNEAVEEGLDAETRWELIRTIKKLLQDDSKEARAAIIKVTRAKDLLSYFQNNLNDERAPGRGKDLRELLCAWDAVMNDDEK